MSVTPSRAILRGVPAFRYHASLGSRLGEESEMIRALLIVVVIVAGLMLLFLLPFLDLP